MQRGWGESCNRGVIRGSLYLSFKSALLSSDLTDMGLRVFRDNGGGLRVKCWANRYCSLIQVLSLMQDLLHTFLFFSSVRFI